MIKKTIAFALVTLIFVISLAKAYNGVFDKIPEFGSRNQSPHLVKAADEEGKMILKMIYHSDVAVEDMQLQDYTERMVKNLAVAAEIKNPAILPFLIKDNSFNASALPGGVLLINLGLLLNLDNHAQLAFVIAHELAHIKLKVHSFAADKAWELLTTWALVLGGAALFDSVVGRSVNSDSELSSIAYAGSISGFLGAYEKLLQYSRQDETEADQIGIDIIIKAGYSPTASVEMFRVLQKFNTMGNTPEFLLTHPYIETRIIQASNRILQYEKKQMQPISCIASEEKFLAKYKLKDTSKIQNKEKNINEKEDCFIDEQTLEFLLMKVHAQLSTVEQAIILADFIKERVNSEGEKGMTIAEKYALAILKLKNNLPKDADKLAKELLAYSSINIHFIVLQSAVYQALGLIDKSLDLLHNAILLRPNSYPLLSEMTKLLNYTKQYTKAEKIARHICFLRPLDPNSWKRLAQIQSIKPFPIDYHISMSEFFLLSGMFSEAKEHLQQALAVIGITKIKVDEIRQKIKIIDSTEKVVSKM
jgi:predicted Zn-dependent protease